MTGYDAEPSFGGLIEELWSREMGGRGSQEILLNENPFHEAPCDECAWIISK
jgi:hypothetical protein